MQTIQYGKNGKKNIIMYEERRVKKLFVATTIITTSTVFIYKIETFVKNCARTWRKINSCILYWRRQETSTLHANVNINIKTQACHKHSLFGGTIRSMSGSIDGDKRQ